METKVGSSSTSETKQELLNSIRKSFIEDEVKEIQKKAFFEENRYWLYKKFVEYN
jgi:hypothetical protein